MRAFLLALALMLSLTGAALAHAQLRGTDPAPGAMLADRPESVSLAFNEPVTPLVLNWVGPDGSLTPVQSESRGTAVIVTPPKDIGSGTQFLSWRVVSADGHPVGGTHSFHVGMATTQAARTDPTPAGAARVAVVARAVLSVALAAALGAVLVPALITASPPDRALRRGGWAAVLLGFGAGLALLAAEGLNLMSMPVAALLTPAPWAAVSASPLMAAVAMIGLALGLAALALAQAPEDRGRRMALALGAWALGAGSFALSGHAATAAPQAVARAALVVHGAALLFWIGALWPLLRLVQAGGGLRELRRFSSLAIPIVGLLVLSGLVLTWLQITDVEALLATPWGGILSVKLALVASLLGLALRNRLILMPGLAATPPRAALRLQRAIRAEIVLAVIIVIVASGLRLVPPPRALAAPPAPILVHLHDPRAMADLRILPGGDGQITLSMGFQTGDFEALVPREVTLTLALPAQGIEPLRAEARLGPDGLWQAGPLPLPRPGQWEVSVRVLITDFESVTLRDSIEIGP